ncbi:islet amyloid polypeptide [Cynoglossus semilaevis]|uniref:Islet amyloid polypeptide n=1 Tax=Cynoglossus semilaevis TaxID=244447 RepID=A0A3P8WB66_CYNSE|nr:islet amyloid polypeptide [Cynoglossus semilaevis]
MFNTKVPALLLLLLVLLHAVTSAPHYRHFTPSSSTEQESALPDDEGWLPPGLITNPFLGIMEKRPQRGVGGVNSHRLEKRKCNTATCVTQRLADFLVRSSNTIGTVYAPTNVGSTAYGKRSTLYPNYLPL